MNSLDRGQHDVLIADDDNDDFELLSDAIRTLDFKIEIKRAENGDILMKLIDEDIPDLLFLDLILPCKDGKACLTEIRNDRRFDELPIIVYTSVTDTDSVDFCFRSGSNLYVYKPGSYTEILEAVEKIFTINWKKLRYYPTRSNFVLNPHVV